MSTWAGRIRELQETGLGLAQIAEEVGLAPSSVGDLATGRSKSPRGEAAVKLANLHTARCSGSRDKNKKAQG